MVNYTPTNEFDFNNIPLTGVLIPGTTVGYVTESKFVKGGYIVVKTLEERDALLDKSLYEDKEIVIGTPVYISEDNKLYRYVGGEDIWAEDTTSTELTDLQKEVEKQATIIADKANTEDLEALTTAVDDNFKLADERVTALETNTAALQTQVKKNTDDIAQRVDGETFFAALMNIDAAINTKADNDFVNKQIGIINDHTMFNDVDELTVYEVGGLAAGSTLKGKSVKEVLMMILYGYTVKKPDYEEPSATLETINNTVGVSSDPLTITGIINFDRGEILLDGNHQGYRAGHASSITIIDPSTGEPRTTQLSIGAGDRVEKIPFTCEIAAVPLGESEVIMRINYGEGDQPLDSTGNPFESPLPAGYFETKFTITGLTNTWTSTENDPDGGTMQQIDEYIITDSSEASIDKSGMFQELNEEGNVTASGYQLTADASIYSEDYTEIYNPITLISSNNRVTGIKVWDKIQKAWVWYRGDTAEESLQSWIASGTTTRTYNDQTIDYTIYKHDGVLGGALQFRFYIA